VILALVRADTEVSGVKATFSNPLNSSQSFSVLLSGPEILTLTSDNIANDLNCDLSQRNCYHWDEMHDWGTFNVTITLEGYVRNWEGSALFQASLFLYPGSCVKVYISGKLVQSQCAFPKFNSGQSADHIKWSNVKEATSGLGGSDEFSIPTAEVATTMLNNPGRVSF
jgi:hypothetical protein